jgi:hypothetical protein
MLAHSLSLIGYLPPEQWLEAWLEASIKALPKSAPEQLAAIARAFGRWGVLPVYAYMRDFYITTAGR